MMLVAVAVLVVAAVVEIVASNHKSKEEDG